MNIVRIVCPFLGIVADVGADTLVFALVADHVTVKTRLPRECDVMLASVFGDTDFVSAYDGRQVL